MLPHALTKKLLPHALSIAAIIVVALPLTTWSQASVQDDAYPASGVWRSFADYQAGVLWVPGIEARSCTNGVESLGGEMYRVPAGVSIFRCAS